VLGFVTVSLGAGSPVRCTRCHGAGPGAGYRPASDVVADITKAAQAWSTGPGPNVSLGGPEPFGHPELPSLVAGASQAGVARLRLETDAAALVSPANASGSAAAGVRHLRFRLLGGSPGVHDALTGEADALAATLAGVRAFAAAAREQDVAVSITALVPVCRHNVCDLPATVGVALEAGADEVTLVVDDGGLDVPAAVPWITAACDSGIVNGVWVEVEGLPYCLLPGYDLHLADTVRERPGVKGPACASCALDDVCAAGPCDAAADTLGSLAPPEDADALSGRVAKSRGLAS
jgi:MoaA/NifB/PqqE/SkfB family radical SAM enzyme